MKINSLQIENVKRVKAVTLEPTPNGLTVIGGKNGQGKTSILDAIAWALGGDRFRPSSTQREDSVIPPFIRVRMDNGLVVERRGKNSDLYVTDPSGKRAGQQLLNTFVEQLALDLPRFMQQSSREKAETLLNILGIGPTLAELGRQERSVYDQRRAVGQIADQKMKYAKEQPFYPDTPDAPVNASELIRQQQEILARNGEHQRLRARRDELKALVDRLSREAADVNRRLEAAVCDLSTAQKDAADLQDESTAELEASIRNVEEINARVRANLDREKAEEDAREYRRQYDGLTGQLEEVRQQKAALLVPVHRALGGPRQLDVRTLAGGGGIGVLRVIRVKERQVVLLAGQPEQDEADERKPLLSGREAGLGEVGQPERAEQQRVMLGPERVGGDRELGVGVVLERVEALGVLLLLC